MKFIKCVLTYVFFTIWSLSYVFLGEVYLHIFHFRISLLLVVVIPSIHSTTDVLMHLLTFHRCPTNLQNMPWSVLFPASSVLWRIGGCLVKYSLSDMDIRLHIQGHYTEDTALSFSSFDFRRQCAAMVMPRVVATACDGGSQSGSPWCLSRDQLCQSLLNHLHLPYQCFFFNTNLFPRYLQPLNFMRLLSFATHSLTAGTS